MTENTGEKTTKKITCKKKLKKKSKKDLKKKKINRLNSVYTYRKSDASEQKQKN